MCPAFSTVPVITESATASKVSANKNDAVILSRINQSLGELGASGRWLKLPEVPAEARAELSRWSIAIVDDVSQVLQNWLPPLGAVCGGAAFGICFDAKTMTPAQAVDELVRRSPGIVLLDHDLKGGVTGPELVSVIAARLPDALIVGFSSSKAGNQALLAAGAHIALDKSSSYQPDATLIALAEAAKTHRIERACPGMDDLQLPARTL